jgi:hypothetical protein
MGCALTETLDKSSLKKYKNWRYNIYGEFYFVNPLLKKSKNGSRKQRRSKK